MSNPDVSPGSVETQQMRVIAPVGVSFQLRLLISKLYSAQFNTLHLFVICFCIGKRKTKITNNVLAGGKSHSRPGRFRRVPTWIDGGWFMIRFISQRVLVIPCAAFVLLFFVLNLHSLFFSISTLLRSYIVFFFQSLIIPYLSASSLNHSSRLCVTDGGQQTEITFCLLKSTLRTSHREKQLE